MRKLLFLFLLFSVFQAFSQLDKYLVFPPYNIKTAWIDNYKRPYFSNITSIDKGFSLSFDDLQADEKDYYYKILRFDEQWRPSQLQPSEYIEGFDSDIITNMKQSTGTLQSYMHYQVSFPNENTRIILSGNYIIQVLDDEDRVVFSKFFILYKKQIEAGIQVRWPENVSIQEEKQQVDFYLYPGSTTIQNETENLSIVLLQNDNWNTKKVYHAPTYYQGNKWVYHFPSYSLFDGINEYRKFETKDIRGVNYNIVKIERQDLLYDFYIYPDEARDKYTYYKDADGHFFILSNQSLEDVNTEADYVYVHFSLNKIPKPGEKIYVLGKFNSYLASKDFELKYNPETAFYEVNVLLKQGYYEYLYSVKNNKNISFVPVEGNFAETENQYQLIVYYRAPGKRYTEVIGYASSGSLNMR